MFDFTVIELFHQPAIIIREDFRLRSLSNVLTERDYTHSGEHVKLIPNKGGNELV